MPGSNSSTTPPRAGQETAQYDAADHILTVHIVNGATTAQEAIAAIQADPASNAAFTASLDTTSDPTNNGLGTITALTTYTGGGTAATLTGTDANPQETAGVFNSLLRMANALQSGDTSEVSRDIVQLQQASQNLSDCQACPGRT